MTKGEESVRAMKPSFATFTSGPLAAREPDGSSVLAALNKAAVAADFFKNPRRETEPVKSECVIKSLLLPKAKSRQEKQPELPSCRLHCRNPDWGCKVKCTCRANCGIQLKSIYFIMLGTVQKAIAIQNARISSGKTIKYCAAHHEMDWL
jgi:hypothetical protein